MKFLTSLLIFFANLSYAAVLVVGDLEGDFEKLESYLKKNTEYFQFEPEEGWSVRDGHQLVFMGDAVDKGPGGIKIVRLLNQLKKAQPDQVSLILGNRDINKMLVYTLLKKTQGMGPSEILRLPYIRYLKETGMHLEESLSLNALTSILEPFDSEELRLKVILKGMNAENAFEFMREELKELLNTPLVDDSMVYREFIRSMEKGGEFLEFLKLGQVMHVIGDSVFVHGGISNENFGKVPGVATRYSDTREWITAMNEWANSEISNWSEDFRRGKALLDYHAPRISGKSSKESVFYHRYSDSSGNPKLPSSGLLKKFENSKIKRAVSAHTPVGEVATIIKSHKFEIIMSDVSSAYSDELPLIKLEPNGTLIESYSPQLGDVVSKSVGQRSLLPDGYLTKDGFRVVGQRGDNYLLLRFRNRNGKFTPEYIERSLDEIYRIGLKSVIERGLEGCLEVFTQEN